MKVFSLFLAFNVLIASTGLSLHTHTCTASDASAVLLSEADCSDGALKRSGCCEASTDCNSENGEEGCCTDSQEYFKEDLLGTAQHEKLNLPSIYPIQSLQICTATFPDGNLSTNTLESGLPPGAYQTPPSVLLQVFRC